jgi:hypothetical protein
MLSGGPPGFPPRPSIPVEESLALGRLAERLTTLHRLNLHDATWVANSLGVPLPILGMASAYFQNQKSLSKSGLLDFMISVYTGFPNRFPRLVEELVRFCLKGFAPRDRRGRLVRKTPPATSGLDGEFERSLRAIESYASVLGLSLRVAPNPDSLEGFDVEVFRDDSEGPRRADKTRLHHILEVDFPEEYRKLQGAYERYTSSGPDAYRSAIESCRSTYEFFFRKLTGASQDPKWSARLAETFPSTSACTFFRDTYSYLSGGGTHSPGDRTREEALLAIRITEDVMVCALSWAGKWVHSVPPPNRGTGATNSALTGQGPQLPQ